MQKNHEKNYFDIGLHEFVTFGEFVFEYDIYIYNR